MSNQVYYRSKTIRDVLLEIRPRRISKSLPVEIKRALGYEWYPSRSAIYSAMIQLQTEGLVTLHKHGKNSVWLWKK